jgi:hypothetical protein
MTQPACTANVEEQLMKVDLVEGQTHTINVQ